MRETAANVEERDGRGARGFATRAAPAAEGGGGGGPTPSYSASSMRTVEPCGVEAKKQTSYIQEQVPLYSLCTCGWIPLGWTRDWTHAAGSTRPRHVLKGGHALEPEPELHPKPTGSKDSGGGRRARRGSASAERNGKAPPGTRGWAAVGTDSESYSRRGSWPATAFTRPRGTHCHTQRGARHPPCRRALTKPPTSNLHGPCTGQHARAHIHAHKHRRAQTQRHAEKGQDERTANPSPIAATTAQPVVLRSRAAATMARE